MHQVLVRLALLTLCVLGLQPGMVQAACEPPLGCPSTTTSTIPANIALVGHDANGVTDPGGRFTITIRNDAGVPLPGRPVIIRIQLASDLTICKGPAVNAGLLISSSGSSIDLTGVTDANGSLSLNLEGCSGGSGVTIGPAATVISGGTTLGSVNVSVLDLDGSGGCNINDLSIFLHDLGSGQNFTRSDFDGSGDIGINDLAVWLADFGAAGSVNNCPR